MQQDSGDLEAMKMADEDDDSWGSFDDSFDEE
jgi:hypothetical protein